ncbi:MAG: hypothetical protein LH605_06725 [Microbacteriaceae bacterium]|nr:hypothetical protein [Microbacteriaceae bacterium]
MATAEGVPGLELASAASERGRERSRDLEPAPAELAGVELTELRDELQGVEHDIRAALEERLDRLS